MKSIFRYFFEYFERLLPPLIFQIFFVFFFPPSQYVSKWKTIWAYILLFLVYIFGTFFFSYYVDWHSDVNFFSRVHPDLIQLPFVCHFFILVAVFFSLFFEFLFIGKFQPSDVSPVMGSLCHTNKNNKKQT